MDATILQTKIRALIVDDEPLARKNIAALLRKDAVVELANEAGSGTEALKRIGESKPDLVYLDVQMPDCDGFDVLEMLGTDAPAAVIFVTAYDRYALKAFEAGALDYLLKPFTNIRLARSLERAKSKIGDRDKRTCLDRLTVKSAGKVRS